MALIRDAMTSRPQSRSSCLDALAASASEDAVPDIGIICGALCRIHSEYTVRLLSDAAWCAAFAAPPPPAARVLIIGLGSGVPALAAARAGCRVVWALRATLAARHLEPVPTELAKANGVNIQLVRVRRWADLTRLVAHGGAFDAVITEELGDDPLADGVLGLARLSRDELLTPSGSFAPSRLRVYARLLSVTMPRRAGFDVSLFNKLRTNAAAAWQDAEHTALVEGSEGCFGLSSPVVLLDVNLNQPSEWTALLEPAGLISRAATVVDRAGVLTCVSTWAELLLPSGGVISLGPLLEKAAPPRPACTRARRQRVHYLPYERTLVEGETVELTVRVTDGALEVSAPLDPMLRASVLHRTEAPPSILESYHFPMLADESRNGAFDRALTGAIARFRSANGGRSPRVLDIGAGSGLLAMMAARAGATEVHSVEMVPELAALATRIVAANGYADRVRVHSAASTDLTLSALGGRADILVCEIVDDLLLGEGVLPTVCDARRRLLTPDATILPFGGALWALPVELLPPSRAGLDLSAFHSFAASTCLTANPNEALKLQHLPPTAYKRLAKPVRLIDINWATAPLEELGRGGESRALPFAIESAGTLTALVLYLSLDLDGTADNELSTGPDSPTTAWDQRARYLPCPLHVQPGETLHLVATHSETYLRSVVIGGITGDMLGQHGIDGLVGNSWANGMAVVMQAPIAPSRAVRDEARAPSLSLARALDPADPALSELLERHGYVILHGIPPSTLALMAECDAQVMPLLRAHCDSVRKSRPAVTPIARPLVAPATQQPVVRVLRVANSTPKQPAAAAAVAVPIAKTAPRCRNSLRIPPVTSQTTLLHDQPAAPSSLQLPFERVGVHAERERGQLRRVQLHLLADERALQMVPWGPSQRGVRDAAEKASRALHTLSTRLLGASDAAGARLETLRAAQAIELGDPSVLDALLYPARESEGDGEEMVGMREHTDPGLLTLTLASDVPALQVRDRATGAWRDVEACAVPGAECIVLCGEALQFATGGRYRATPHRVVCAADQEAARLSTVFELRVHDVSEALAAAVPVG